MKREKNQLANENIFTELGTFNKINNMNIKNFFLTLNLLGFFMNAGAQENIQLMGTVLDSKTERPVEYVNVGIFEKNIGTVSNDSGIFILNIPTDKIKDAITFSRIGYYNREIKISEILKNNPVKVYLKPRTIQLDEVKILSKKLKVKTKGNKSTSRKIVLGIGSSSLGKETGTLIKLPDKEVLIKDLNFHIVTNRPDSAKFRFNIYSYEHGIKNNLLKKNIYFTVHKNDMGDYKVDLSKYNIVVHGDVFVSVEVVALYSKGPDPNIKNDKYFYDRINISGTLTGSKSFYRKVSLGKWEKTGYSFSPGFWLTVAY